MCSKCNIFSNPRITRRTLVKLAGLAPLSGVVKAVHRSHGLTPLDDEGSYILSANIETLFEDRIPRARRIELLASFGMRAFSFWTVPRKEEKAMLEAQKRTGLACGSIAGSGSIGWSTGLTRTGHEQAYMDVITRNCEVAARFGAPNLVIFVGKVQEDISWAVQYRQIVDGLRKAGEIAKEYGVHLCLEPLNRVESPEMSVLTARAGFAIVEQVNHPHVKLDFDMYHLQLSEGNLINNLRYGFEHDLIQFVEIGDVPGRKEPGTGEVNYSNIFQVLRDAGYEGYVGMEHGTSSTPENAVTVVREIAGKV